MVTSYNVEVFFALWFLQLDCSLKKCVTLFQVHIWEPEYTAVLVINSSERNLLKLYFIRINYQNIYSLG